jgi:hypothetical protein
MQTQKTNDRELLNLPNENWITIPQHPAYEISDLGRLRKTYKNTKVKIIKAHHNGNGKTDYQFYVLGNVKYYAHFLVTYFFIGQRPAGYDCDHIDGNRSNNALSNLRYLTRAENRSHKGEQNKNSKLTEAKVRLIRLMYKSLKDVKTTQKQIGAMWNVSSSAVGAVINNKTWKHVTV